MAPVVTAAVRAGSAMGVVVRPLELSDAEALAAIDGAYAAALGIRPQVSRASLHYFQRTGHSFVAELSGPAVVGLVLAHSVWGGAEAAVRIERLALRFDTASAVDETRIAEALTAAVVKSAYDAGVYRLVAAVPDADDLARGALSATLFEPETSVVYQRRLGSGTLSGADAGAADQVAGVGSRRRT